MTITVTIFTSLTLNSTASICKAVAVNYAYAEIKLLLDNYKSGKQRVLFFRKEPQKVNYLLSALCPKDNDLKGCVVFKKNSRKYLGQSENQLLINK